MRRELGLRAMTLGKTRLLGLMGATLLALTLSLALTVAGGPASAATGARASGGPGAPGSFTGYGFDTCSAPPQAVMDAWWQESPYAAVGIYIGGSNRLCDQPELTAGWVSTQQQRGWHLLPAYVGPQASCSAVARSDDILSA